MSIRDFIKNIKNLTDPKHLNVSVNVNMCVCGIFMTSYEIFFNFCCFRHLCNPRYSPRK